MKHKTEKATFAAGCFWGVEEVYRKLPGVICTRVGYTGGHTKKPTYEEVCSDQTGHAESVDIDFDPKKSSYEKLLDIFWSIHDPTMKNRQGRDVGSQYRSAIFYHSAAQKKTALESKKKLEEKRGYNRPIVTEIAPAQTFWLAEEYHQQYLAKRSANVCH